MTTFVKRKPQTGVISFRVGSREQEALKSYSSFYGLKPAQLAKQALIEKLEDLEDLYYAEKARNSGSKRYSLEEVAAELGISL